MSEGSEHGDVAQKAVAGYLTGVAPAIVPGSDPLFRGSNAADGGGKHWGIGGPFLDLGMVVPGKHK